MGATRTTRDNMTFFTLLLLPLLVPVLGEMRCYFTTDKEQFTKIPDVLTCLCREQEEEEMFSVGRVWRLALLREYSTDIVK